MYEQRACNAAWLRQVGMRDIIGNYHHFDFLTKRARFLRCKTEVKPVAGVVLDNQDTACPASDRHDSRQHRIDAGRSKHLSADRRGQHALADKTRMSRLMSR